MMKVDYLYAEADSVKAASGYILTILLMFLIGCMIGYCMEVLYRRFYSAKKWVNPGFMRGPWLPLYGFGLVSMFLISAIIINALPESMPLYNPLGHLFTNTNQCGPTVYDLIPIAIIFACLILLEFLAGLIFVKGFKVRLWDYSNLRGNILGIICPQFSIIWLIVDLIYYYGLNPYVYNMFSSLYKFMFEGGSQGTIVNVFFIFALGIVYGILIIDFITSLNVFNKIVKLAKNSNTLKHYEKFREEQKADLLMAKAKLAALIPEDIKQKHAENKAKAKERNSKIKNFFNKLMYIDPNKISDSDNYDADGRPKTEE